MMGKKLLFLLGLSVFQVNATDIVPEQQTWVEELSTQFDLPEQELNDAIALAKLDESVLNKIQTPWEKKPWYKYYPIFITDSRINKGVAYWREHEKTFARAEQQYGIPAEIIVSIMGVETFYGKYKGDIPVLDSLYTLGFHYPPRGKFFRQEFAQYIKLSKQQDWSLRDTHGSYAGAMGLGQFISSSYRHYGVDFSGDGKVDMINDPVDAIGSIANYFASHKWQPGAPVAYPVKVSDLDAAPFLDPTLSLQQTWGELKAANITLGEGISISDDTPVKLLKLQRQDGAEYWVYLNNFYTITRYNHSPLYAMTVFQLSEHIKQAKDAK